MSGVIILCAPSLRILACAHARLDLGLAAGSSPKSVINDVKPLREVLEQRVARLDDTTVLFVAAACVWMRGLGQ